MPTKRAKRRRMSWSRKGKPVASQVPLGSPLQRIRYTEVPYSELAMHVGIAGKRAAIKNITGTMATVEVDGKEVTGTVGELINFPQREPQKPELGVCDNCEQNVPVKRLNTGGNSGIFLCRPCWAKEMNFRRERNIELSPEARFDILPFDESDVQPKQSSYFNELLTKDVLTEQEVKLLMRRINDGKINISELMMKRYDTTKKEAYKLTSEQVEKARQWWLKNKRFAQYREQEVIDHLAEGFLVGAYSPDNKYYYPYYRLESDANSFSYVVIGGVPQIMG